VRASQKRGLLPRCFGHVAGKKITPPRHTVFERVSFPALWPFNALSVPAKFRFPETKTQFCAGGVVGCTGLRELAIQFSYAYALSRLVSDFHLAVGPARTASQYPTSPRPAAGIGPPFLQVARNGVIPRTVVIAPTVVIVSAGV
jgi:hypothetical protein